MLALLGLSIFGYGYMRQGFFPDMVYDQLYMEYKLPEGNNSTRVARDLREIESYLKHARRLPTSPPLSAARRDATTWCAASPIRPCRTAN